MNCRIKIILILLVVQHSTPECGDQCSSDRVCTGETDEVITIPCGSYSENSEVTFKYHNESSTVNKSAVVLLDNSTECLVLNLTAYDDNTEISCESSETKGAKFIYDLSVHYSPRTLSKVEYRVGSFQKEYRLDCPLHSNPLPSCSWDLIWCTNSSLVDPSEVHYSSDDDGCTLVITKLTLIYTIICFNCTATNKIGSSIYHFTSIDFNTCSEDSTGILLPKPTNGSTLILTMGQNLTLTCLVTGVSLPIFQKWTINATNNTYDDYFSGDAYMHNYSLCTQTMTLSLKNVSYNDSGIYTCIYSINGEYNGLSVRILVNNEKESKPNLRKWIGGSAGVFVFLAIILTSIVIPILFYLIRRKHLKWNNPGDHSYDVFLSFAQEDEEIVEKKIKIPLEDKDYRVLWHHFDFIGGVAINENMRDAVNKSRVTITVLSEHFLASDFCKAEMNFALMKETDTHFKCLIPVLIDDCDVPPELKNYTYISVNEPNFLDKLYRDLGDPLEVERPMIISLRHSSFGYTTLDIQ